MIALSRALSCVLAQAGGRRVLVVDGDGSTLAHQLAGAGYDVTTVEAAEDIRSVAGCAAPDAELAASQPRYDAAFVNISHDNPSAQRRMFLHLRRLLTADGMVIVGSDPARDIAGGHPWGRYREQLIDDMSAAGFTREEISAAILGRSDQADRHLVAARPAIAPPRSLAVYDWGEPAEVELDLRYCPDETDLLTVSPSAVWKDTLASSPLEGADLLADYPVHDPFGGNRGAEVVAAHFGCRLSSEQVTFAAGVTSLLHDLHRLADAGPILAPSLIHPDLGAWAVARGAPVQLLYEPADHRMLLTRVESTRPGLVQLDRPGFTGEAMGLDELRDVADRAACTDAVVVVDESAAAYLGSANSAVQLVPETHNVIVLRGFTKVYSWGGLRGGYAVASANVADRIREVVAPMQMGELAFAAALRMLAAGDVTSALRSRIRAVKPGFCASVTSLGMQITHRGHPDVPWIVVDNAGAGASQFLDSRLIRGLAPAPAVTGITRQLLHLSVPLSDDRMRLFQQLTSGPERRPERPFEPSDAVEEDQLLMVWQRW